MMPRSGYGPIVVHSYRDPGEAEAAVRSLRDAGFGANQISVAAREREQAERLASSTGTDAGQGAAIGAATGGILGGIAGLLVGAAAVAIPGVGVVVAGPLAMLLGGAVAGGLTGGIAGALAGIGVSQEEAEQFQDRFEQGEIIVAVAAGDREAEVRDILHAGRAERR